MIDSIHLSDDEPQNSSFRFTFNIKVEFRLKCHVIFVLCDWGVCSDFWHDRKLKSNRSKSWFLVRWAIRFPHIQTMKFKKRSRQFEMTEHIFSLGPRVFRTNLNVIFWWGVKTHTVTKTFCLNAISPQEQIQFCFDWLHFVLSFLFNLIEKKKRQKLHPWNDAIDRQFLMNNDVYFRRKRWCEFVGAADFVLIHVKHNNMWVSKQVARRRKARNEFNETWRIEKSACH